MSVVTGSEGQAIRVWDLASGQPTRLIRGHKGRVAGLAVSPDGRQLASAVAVSSLKLWGLGLAHGDHTTLETQIQILNVKYSRDGK